MLSQLKMEDLNDNELGFTLGLETNSLFNDELNLNSISHDYIKNGDDLFLTNDENWLSSLDSDENAFNHSLTNQQTNIINQQNESNRLNNQEINQTNSLLIKKKRKLEYDNNFGILNNEVDNVIEISEMDTNQRLKSVVNVDNKLQLNQKEFNKLDLNKKATKLLGKPIKNEYVQEQFYQEKENSIKEELESDQEEDNDLDEDEEIDELLRFPVSSSILDDQCGSPTELNQLNNLLHDSDSGSVFDDGYLSAASTFNLNTNSQLLNENRRQLKSANLLSNQTQNNGTSNDQLYQVHNYSCIKQDKFLHSANNQQLLNTTDNQLIYLKHDGFLNGNSNYTSSNSSLSGGSQSSSPTQSPKARKSNYGRRQIKGGNLITSDDQRQNLNKSTSANQQVVSNLKSQQQQQQQQTNGRGSRFKPITDLHLTDEERRLLNKEGYVNFPSGDNPQLSKMEEKILRKIRRKIRNKRSAQCSRQRKKEYLEELEKKYSNCTNEVQSLKSEVLKLRREKVSLISKIQKLMCSVDNQHQQQLELNDDEGESLPETITCGENIQINNKIIIESNQKTQLDQQNLDNQLANDDLVLNNDELSNNELNECLVNNLDNLEIDYLLTSNDDNLQFDFDNFNNNFEISDLKDDGLLHYVNNFTNNDNQLIVENSNQLIDYHQQAPVKTSLFLLVFFILILFVPFIRLDVLDNSLEALENQIGQQSNELISSNQQLTAIL